MTYSPSGDELETQISCEVLALEPDIQQDQHRYFARAFNTLHRICLWHTHASVAPQLNNQARAGRNSLQQPFGTLPHQRLSSPPNEKQFLCHWLGTGVSIWSWVGSNGQPADCAPMSCVTAAFLCAPVHLFRYNSYPYFTFCPKTFLDCHWIHIVNAVEGKGHPRYKSSFQNNKVITIHLDTAQLSTEQQFYSFNQLLIFSIFAIDMIIVLISI